MKRVCVKLYLQGQRIESDHLKLYCSSGTKRAMSENAILYLIHRLDYKGRMTGHGWRKIGSTWANENEFNADHVEAQLAHKEGGVRGVYNSAEYLKQRRVMLQVFADWLFL